MGVSLAASLTALIASTPDLQAAIDPAPIETSSMAADGPRMKIAQGAPDAAPVDRGYQGAPPPGFDGAWGAIQDWLARANREYQGVVIKRLSLPPQGGAGTDEIARKIEETKAEAARAAAATQAEDAAQKAAEAKQRDDAQKADAASQDEEKAAVAKAKAEAAAKKAADAKQREDAQKAEAERRAADAKAKAQAEAAAKKAEDAKQREDAQKAEAERRAADAKAKTQAETEAKVKPVKREPPAARAPADAKAAEEAAAKAEAQRLANEREEQAQRDADERRKAAAEARRLEDEQRNAEARIADERRRAADAERAAASREDRRTVLLTTEPISRPRPAGTTFRRELASRRVLRNAGYAYDDRPSRRRYDRGTRVKRWVHRAQIRGACHAAGRRIKPPGRYTVARGDSLWRISSRHYRSGRLYRKIYRANRGLIRRPDRIYPCQRFHVPRRRG